MALEKLTNGNFGLGIDITADGSVKKTLKTADTYVDRNIEIEVNVPDAAHEVKEDNAVTAVVSTNNTDFLTDSETPFAFDIQADASSTKATVGVKEAGFAAATDTIEVTAKTAEADVKTKYIKAGSLADPDALAMTVEGGNGVEVTAVGSAPEKGFFIKTTATGTVEVGTAGWIPQGTAKDVTGEKFYTIPTLTLGNAASDDVIYTDASEDAPILVSGDYLYINEGYTEAMKISLAKLVPDGSNVTGQNNLVYKTVSVYDNDGNLVAGSMGDAELSAITANDATAEIKTVTVTAKEDGSAFDVTGAGAITGTTHVAVSKTGYATTELEQTGEITGDVTLNATIDVVGLKAEKTEDGAVTPEIKKEASTALSGEIATVAPTGKKYVAISADAIAQTVTVTPEVATAGYGTADTFNKTTIDVVGGTNASGTYYVPIDNGGHEVSHTQELTQEAIAINMAAAVSDASYSIAGVSAVEPTDVPYITISTSNTSTAGQVVSQASCTTTEGYVLSGTDMDTAKTDVVAAQVTQAANKFIKIYTGIVIE